MLILPPSWSREPIQPTDPLTLSSPLPTAGSAPFQLQPPPPGPGPQCPFALAWPCLLHLSKALTMALESHRAPGNLGKADGNHSPEPNRSNFKLKVRCHLYKFMARSCPRKSPSLKQSFPQFQPSFQSSRSPPPCCPGLSHLVEEKED